MELYLLSIDEKAKNITIELNKQKVNVKYWGGKTSGHQEYKWKHDWEGSKKELEELANFIDEVLWNYV